MKLMTTTACIKTCDSVDESHSPTHIIKIQIKDNPFLQLGIPYHSKNMPEYYT